MTHYETLIKKSLLCREAAKKTSGEMSLIWQSHAEKLETMAEELTVSQATKKE